MSRVLSGDSASDLYLQCLQLLLWHQCHFLVTVKGLPTELETTVRDLWSLRITPGLNSRKDERDGTSCEKLGWSSQSDASGTESEASVRTMSSTWEIIDIGLPRLKESLAICYLGCVLLKLPVSIAQLCRWAVEGDLVYLRAVSLPATLIEWLLRV